jgi:hypothetical protein
MKRTSATTPARKARSGTRDRRVEKSIARALSTVLRQVFQWRSGPVRTSEEPRAPRRFDVKAVFDALNEK